MRDNNANGSNNNNNNNIDSDVDYKQFVESRFRSHKIDTQNNAAASEKCFKIGSELIRSSNIIPNEIEPLFNQMLKLITTFNQSNASIDSHVQSNSNRNIHDHKHDNIAMDHDSEIQMSHDQMNVNNNNIATCQKKLQTQKDDLDVKLQEIDRLINDTSNLQSNLNKVDKIDNRELRQIYADAIKTAKKQSSEQVRSTANKVRTIFQTKLTIDEIMNILKNEIAANEKRVEQCEKRFKRMSARMLNLRLQLEQTFNQYFETQENFYQLKQENDKYKNDNTNNTIQKHMVNGSQLIDQCNQILTKYNQFSGLAKDYTKCVTQKYAERIEEFESKWLNWGYHDTVFWFKLKLGYFLQVSQSNDNDSSGEDADWEGGNDDKKKNDDNNILARVDFTKVHKSLKSQKIRGKFLSLLNRRDLKGLGFKIFEHRCVLAKAIEALVDKYPIPQEPDPESSDNDNDGEEGSRAGFGSTAGYTRNEAKEGGDYDRYDAKYICPITKRLMKIPVIAYDGETYEREAVVEYMKTNHALPTGVKITVVPNSFDDMVFPDHELEMELKKLYNDELKKK